jgi:cellulose synthase/poly-beta-1,6-N-acetylglucosamine synthase-like glycosyltransferase
MPSKKIKSEEKSIHVLRRSQPKISVVVATSGLVSSLPLVLRSLDSKTLDKNHYEVIVVYNCPRLPRFLSKSASRARIRHVHEPRIGLSHARNAGLQAASSPYVAYLDDDAIPDPNWLKQLLQAFARYHKKRVAVIGGKILPLWLKELPAWYPSLYVSHVSLLDLGKEEVISEDRALLAGANCAFLKQALLEVGGFSEEFGRKGKNLRSAEEILVANQILAKGYKCLYLPSASVRHIIFPQKLTRWWIVKRVFWEGVSSTRMQMALENMTEQRSKDLAQAHKLELLRKNNWFRIIKNYFSNSPEEFTEVCTTAKFLGEFLALRRDL